MKSVMMTLLFIVSCSGAPFGTAEMVATDPPETVRPTVVAVTPDDPDAQGGAAAQEASAPATIEASAPAVVEASAPAVVEAGAPAEASPAAEANAPAPLCQPYTLAGPFIVLSLAPTSLDFGDVPVGQSSVLTASLTNSGSCAGPTQAAGGAPENPAFVALTSCGGGRVLAPGQSCSIDYTFTPVSPGAQASVSAWTFAGEPFAITLRGVGK